MIIKGNYESYAFAMLTFNYGLVEALIEKDKFSDTYEIKHPMELDKSILTDHEIVLKWDADLNLLKEKFEVEILEENK